MNFIKRAENKKFPLQSLLKISLALGLLGIIAWGMFIAQGLLQQGFSALKSEVLADLTRLTGCKLSYLRISPSLLRCLAISGLTLKNEQSSETVINVKDFKIYYNLSILMFAHDRIKALQKVELEGGNVSITAERETRLLEFISDFISSPAGGYRLDSDFSLKIKGLNLDFKKADMLYEVHDLFASLQGIPNTLVFNLQSAIKLSQDISAAYLLQTELTTAGWITTDFKQAEISLSLSKLILPGAELSQQDFEVVFNNDHLTLTKAQARLPLHFTVDYDLPQSKLSARFLAEDLILQSLLTFTGEAAFLKPLLATRFYAKGGLVYDLTSQKLDYALDCQGELLQTADAFNLSFETKIAGNEEQINFSPFVLKTSLGGLSFAGNILYQSLMPEGRLVITNLKTPFPNEINASFAVKRQLEKVSLNASQLIVGQTSLAGFLLDIYPHEQSWAYFLKAFVDEQSLQPSIELAGELNFNKPPSLSFTGFCQGLSLLATYQALRTPSVSSEVLAVLGTDFFITSSLEFKTNFKTFNFKAPDFRLTSKSDPQNSVSFELEADSEHLSVSNLKGIWGDYPLSGQLKANFEREAITLAADFRIAGQTYQISGGYSAQSGLVLSGQYDFLFLLIPDERDGFYLALTTSGLPLPIIKDQVLQADLDWIGHVGPRDGLELISRRTRIANLPALVPGMRDAKLDLNFAFANERLTLSRIIYSDTTTRLIGNGLYNLNLATDLRVEGWVYLADESQSESYTAFFDLGPAANEVRLFFQGSPLARLGYPELRGYLSGNLTLTGSPTSPLLEGEIALAQAKLNTEDLAGQVNFSFSKDRLSLNSLRLKYGPFYELLTGQAAFNFNLGEFEAELTFLAHHQPEPLRASVGLKGMLPNFNTITSFPSFFEHSFSGELSFRLEPTKEFKEENWKIGFFNRGNTLQLKGGPDDSILGYINKEGAFSFKLRKPFLMQGNISGQIKDDFLELEAKDFALDLKALNFFINSPYFYIKSGSLFGNLRLSGPIQDPDFSGELAIEDFIFSSQVFANEIGPLQGPLALESKTIRLKQSVKDKGGPRIGVEASLVFDHWNVSRLTSSFRVTEQPGLYLTLPIQDFFIEGYVTSPSFSLNWEDSGLAFTGSLAVQRCTLVWGASDKPQTSSEVQDDFNYVVDLTITLGKQVEFLWPIRQLPVLRLTAKPGAELKLRYNKLQNLFSLSGDINISSGSVYYVERDFVIREASLSFNENQLSFDPLLTLRAERHFRYHEQDVKLILRANKQRLSCFEPQLESEPPLPITERYLALGGIIQNQPADSQEEFLAAVLSDLGGELLTQLLLLRPLQDRLRQFLNLDSFSIRTQFVKNLLADTLFFNRSEETTTTAISLGRYLNNTEISFQKYLDEQNDLFFEMILRFQAEGGYGLTEPLAEQFGNINLQSEFSLELTTPFFLTIKWSIIPQHWESFFLPDSKITFKWGTYF